MKICPGPPIRLTFSLPIFEALQIEIETGDNDKRVIFHRLLCYGCILFGG